MKIIIINHTFQHERYNKRWKMLAEMHPDWDVTLLAPTVYKYGSNKTVSFGFVEERHGYEHESENFHIKLMRTKKVVHFGWTSKDMLNYIKTIQPDVVYHIGNHRQESLMQIIDYKKRHAPQLKVFAFSMRGPQQDLSNIDVQIYKTKNPVKKIVRKLQLKYESNKVLKLNRYCDAVFCHYPDGMKCFRAEGYSGPIFMQTQVGVDTDVYYQDPEKREKIRQEYNIGNAFLFASALRFSKSKGALQVLDALPIEGNWKYMLMGSGTAEEVETVKEKIKERGIENKVILPGFVQRDEMAEYWNAADCAIHFAQTTNTWVETFSLSLVQAMATKLPAVGSNSGSVPYQIGPDGIIVDEKDVKGLHEKLQWVIDHQKEAKEIGIKLYQRTVNSFSICHLDNLFYATVNDLMQGIYDEDKIDMTNT